MVNSKISIIMVCAFALLVSANAQQIVTDPSLSVDFNAQVKSLEEFQNRFNGIEHKPGLATANDSSSRRLNILNLFDFRMNKKGVDKESLKKTLNSFIDSVLYNNYYFNAVGANLWSECKCRFKYKGVNKKITLIFQKELVKDDIYRWAIVGVKGLPSAGIINTEKFYSISPVEHEIYFLGLVDLLNENPSHAFGYRAKEAKVDQLSVFLTLIQCGLLKFDIVENQVYHCLGVPGYVFTIEEKARTGQNSGWLIGSLLKKSSVEKVDYLNKLFEDEK